MVDTANYDSDNDSDDISDSEFYHYELEQGETLNLGTCQCCGNDTRVAVGFITRVYDGNQNYSEAAAAYHVRWTVNRVTEEGANFDIMIMDDEEGTILVSLQLFEDEDDNNDTESERVSYFKDAAGRPLAEMARRVLTREQVLSSPDVKELASSLTAVILMGDTRIRELTDAGFLGSLSNAK